MLQLLEVRGPEVEHGSQSKEREKQKKREATTPAFPWGQGDHDVTSPEECESEGDTGWCYVILGRGSSDR